MANKQGGITLVVDETMQEARFAGRSVSDNDEFEQIIVSFGHLVLFPSFTAVPLLLTT